MRQIIIFDKGLVVVGMEFGKEEFLDKTDLVNDVVDGNRCKRRWWRKIGERGGRESAE